MSDKRAAIDTVTPFSDPPCRRLMMAIGIATVGRPQVLLCTLMELQRQTRPADAIFVCAPDIADVAGIEPEASGVTVIISPRGSSHQRNAILDRVDAFDAIMILDDDFVPSPRYLEAVEQTFLRHPDVVISTGLILADDVCGPGLTHDDARRLLEGAEQSACDPDAITDVDSGYGCNMAVRLQPVRTQRIRFDERLPLYAWLEDVDFSGQLARHGRIVYATATQGVHLGVKAGRSPGRRLGYSQVANPIYLMRKGTCSWRKAVPLMSRNIAANLYGCIRPEPYIDRLGRTVGNIRAIVDLFAGRLDPARVLRL